MNKLFTKIATAFVGIAMAIGVGVAVDSSKEASSAQATSPAAVTFSELSLGNAHVMGGSDVSLEKGLITFAWGKGSGSNAPTYYDSGTSVRLYCPKSSNSSGLGGKVTISLTDSDYYITSITYSFGTTVTSKGVVKAGSKASVVHSISSSGTVTTATYTSSDNIQSVEFQAKNTSSSTKQCYLSGVSVSYGGGSSPVSVTGVSVSPTAASIGVGGTQQLTPTITPSNATDKAVTYESDATGVATVDANGLITAVTAGSATITVTTHDGGFTATCAVTVTAPKTPASLATTGQTTSFEAGNKFTYGGTSTVTYTDSTSKSVTPSSFKIGNAGINPISAGTVIVPGTTVLNRNDHHGKTVYVLYEENSTTVYASYTISVAAITKISFVGGTDTGTASGQGESDTLTKSGISMSCDSCYTTSGAYRFYGGSTLTISSTVGNIAKIEFNMNGSYNSNLLSTSTGTYNDDDSSKGVWTGEAASIAFDLSAQARCNSVDITLASNDPLVELAPASSTTVSMLKGDEDTSVKVLVKNIETKTWSFTFDEDEQEGITTSSYISVSAGDAVSDVHTLTITTKATGSTTMHISVSGTACATAVPVTVNAKPASIAIKSGNTLELQNGGPSSKSSRGYTKASLTIKDTDGNDYSITTITDDVTLTNVSGDDCVTISGGTITAKSVGECTVRFSLNILPSVYTDLSVSVINDYNISVNSVIFNSDLMDDQGKSIAHTNIFDTREANTHFGVVADILDSEIKYSYNPNDAANAVSSTAFYYDFNHGTTDPEFGEGYKDQTIYVYFSFDNWETVSYTTTFSVIIAQNNIDLESISLDTGSSLSLQRNTSHQLVVSYSPNDTTSTREVSYEIVSSSEGSTIGVSSGGLITAGDRPGSTARIKVTSLFSSSIHATVDVETTLESMTYTVSEPVIESFVQITDENDIVDGEYLMVGYYETGDTYYYYNSSTGADNYQTGTVTVNNGTIAVTDDLKGCTFRIESMTGGYSFKNKTNPEQYISASGVASDKNGTTKTNDAQANTITLNDDGESFTISSNSHFLQMNPNKSGDKAPSPLFRYYKSTSASYIDLLLFKYESSGGDTPHNVDVTLFNAIQDNFGDSDTTYTWSDTCPSFNLSSWTTAGNAVTGITGFSSYKLNLAVGNIEGNEIEVFIAKYDNVVAKFYKDCKTDQEKAALDFLGRVTSGKVTPLKRVMILGDNAFNSNTSIIVVIVSLVSAVSVGGYFFLRKKKED